MSYSPIHKLSLIFLLLFVAATQCPANTSIDQLASQRWQTWRKSQAQYPIAAWAFFNRYDGTKSEYDVYAADNLTFVSVPVSQYDNAISSGLEVMLGGWEKLDLNAELLKKRIALSNASKGRVIGYQLADEPEPNSFTTLADAVRTIYENDNNGAIPIIDMLPNWAWQRSSHRMSKYGCNYDEFIDRYISAVHPPVLMSCHYPTLADGSDRPEYYANLETLRDHALRNNIGLMAFVLCTEIKGQYRRPSDSDLRWQVYSALAYGAQGIWYWNWRIKPDEKSGYTEGLVLDKTGEPTPEYHLVQKINTEVHTIGSVLMKLRSRNVFHSTDSVPPGGRRLPDVGISGSSAIERFVGESFLIGEFRSADDASDDDAYIMVVNKRHGMGKASTDPSLQAAALFKPSSPYTHVYEYDKKTGRLNLLSQTVYDGEQGYYALTLGGGEGILLRLARAPRS